MRTGLAARLYLPKSSVVIALVLVTAILLFAFGSIADLRDTAPLSVKVVPLPQAVPTSKAPTDALATTPLVYSARRLFVPPQQSAAPPRPDFRLVGILTSPSKAAVAILAPNEGETGGQRRVRQGDILGGWRISRVKTDRVILEYEGEQFEIARAGLAGSGKLATATINRNASGNAPTGLVVLGRQSGKTRPSAPAQIPDVAPRGREALLAYMRKSKEKAGR